MDKRIDSERLPIGAMYAPFCRTKYVDQSAWDGDIKTMSELGYTCLHGFAEWWRIEYVKGQFDFSQTDYLIETAFRHGVTPIINVATQNGVGYYMPGWMMDEYKGQGMVDNDGHARNSIPCEYPSACMDDPWYQVYARRYLRALAKHYANDARIGGWVIWGEPVLSFEGKPICYCEHTIKKFREWLRKKYAGDIDRLNSAWGNEGPAHYADFTCVRPPVGQSAQRGSYASWGDFRTFMDENLAGHILEADRLFKECGATQPTIAELFCYVGDSNAWELSKSADIVGVSNFLRPGFETELVMTIANSLAKPQRKSFFVVEANGGPRYPNYDKRTPGGAELVSEAAQMLGSGAKGLMYWCYRPRLSDFEAGTFGMCKVDGAPLKRARDAGEFARAIQPLAGLIQSLEWRSEVAVFSSRITEHLSPADNMRENYSNAVQGAMRALLDAHITPQLINEEWLRAGMLEGFKALVLPCAYILDDDVIDIIADFAERGGLVIADQYLGMKRASGVAHMTWPGGRLGEVFGIRREDVLYLDHPSLIPETPMRVDIDTCFDLVVCEGARVAMRFGEQPLVTDHEYSLGAGVFLAWQAFCTYRKGAYRALRELLKERLGAFGVKPYITLPELDARDEPRICVSVLYAPDGARVYSLVNPSYEPVELIAYIDNASKATALPGAARITSAAENGRLRVCVSLGAWESALFKAET